MRPLRKEPGRPLRSLVLGLLLGAIVPSGFANASETGLYDTIISFSPCGNDGGCLYVSSPDFPGAELSGIAISTGTLNLPSGGSISSGIIPAGVSLSIVAGGTLTIDGSLSVGGTLNLFGTDIVWADSTSLPANGNFVVSGNISSGAGSVLWVNGTPSSGGGVVLSGGAIVLGGSGSSGGAITLGGSSTPGGPLVIGGAGLSLETWLESLGSHGQLYAMNNALSQLPLEGAHHRPLTSYALEGGNCFWATGDIGRQNRHDSNLASGELGLCRDFLANQLRAGLGLGYSGLRQDTPLGGKNELDGLYLVGEADWRLGSDTVLSLTALHGNWDADLLRAYLNGLAVDYSRGASKVKTSTVRLRADWLLGTLHKTRFEPWISFGISRSKVDAYTETGGGLPASFNAQTDTQREVRLGLAAIRQLTPKLGLRANLEGIHNFDDRGPGISGIDGGGLLSFSLPGAKVEQSWLRAGADLDYRIAPNSLVSCSVHAASTGRDASVSGAISLRLGF